ncbi:MAG: hypothetical protein AAGE52_30560 [Myxococcota bacterium]
MRWLVLAFAVFLARPTLVRACATCTVGDPTLTVLGTGQPAEARRRLGLVIRHHRERIDDSGSVSRLQQERYDLGFAWAPGPRGMISVQFPFAHQRVTLPNLARVQRWALADVSVRGRIVLFRDRVLGARHLFNAIVGLELPTATRPRDVPEDLRAGSGTWDPIVGLSYNGFAGAWSGFISLSAIVPMTKSDGLRFAPALQSIARLQFQPTMVVGVHAYGQLRHEGRRGDSAGGTLVRSGVGVILSPLVDLVLYLQGSLPLWQDLEEGRREEWLIEGGATVDF